MRKIIIYAALVLATMAAALPAAAQANVSYEGKITVDPVRLAQSGETLHVEADFVMEDMRVYTTGAVALVPRLVSPSDTLELPRVLLLGRNEYLAHERRLSLTGRNAYEQPYRLEKSTKPESYTIAYRHALRFEPWMREAWLELRCDEFGCGDLAWTQRARIADRVTLEKTEPYRPVLAVAYVQPPAEEVKSREKQVETFLDFEVNKTVIRPEYMNNPRELAKIRTMIDELYADTDITIDRLDIIGYASPEGSLANNRRLSEGRANALKNYLAAQYTFPASVYRTVFGGENWEGLRTALDDLDIAHKDEIAAVIDGYEGDERKNRLKSLRGGQPYAYLLRNVYPALRVAVCKVEYRIKSFDVNEAREIIKVRPQNLSLNEMYMVANTYPAGSQEFIDVFETAVRLFPRDETAMLNAAVSALSRGDAATAERYLGQIGDHNSPEYLNAAGALATLHRDYAAAESYLRRAADAGLEAARKNLEELEKVKLEINQ